MTACMQLANTGNLFHICISFKVVIHIYKKCMQYKTTSQLQATNCLFGLAVHNFFRKDDLLLSFVQKQNVEINTDPNTLLLLVCFQMYISIVFKSKVKNYTPSLCYREQRSHNEQ